MDHDEGLYVVSGSWNLLGERHAGNVPGGRVELPTPAFSGPRSTGELPRHRGVKDSTGVMHGCQLINRFGNVLPSKLLRWIVPLEVRDLARTL